MYVIEITPFGPFEKYTFSHQKYGNRFSLVPGYGACLLELVFQGMNILDGYDTPEALIENSYSKNVVLFPFPNRLKDGKYEHQGKTYSFPLNNAATGNAIHGFGKDKPMHVSSYIVTHEMASVTCYYHHEGNHPGYPFPFAFGIEMTMYGEDSFEVELLFRNEGKESIPAGLGWHPYFSLGGQVNDWSLQMPQCTLVEIDERMLPNGKRSAYHSFDALCQIGDTNLDNCFALSGNKGHETLFLQSGNKILQYWQETGPGKFNFLQIFTPAHRRSMAIEPMTCNVDAFNNRDGLILLDKGASIDAKFGLNFTTNLPETI